MNAQAAAATDLEFAFANYALDVVFGRNTIEQMGPKLDSFGFERAMVLCGPRIIKNSNVVQRTEAALGSRLVGRFAEINEHQLIEDLVAARDEARQVKPDVLVSVGGGSSHTAAKVVAMMLSTDRDLRDFQPRFKPPDTFIEPSVPLPEITTKVVVVATTMGGAEIGASSGGFTDKATGEKVTLFGRGASSPRVVFVDGEALLTTPDRVQRGSTMGQLRVLVESFSGIRHNPVSDALGLHGLRLMFDALREGWQRDVDYLLRIKTSTMIASLCGMANGTIKGMNTALAHQIGAQTGIPHGEANSIILPHTMRFNSEYIPGPRFSMLRQALGLPASESMENRNDAGDVVAEMCGNLGLPARLRDVGIERDALPSIAKVTFRSAHLAGNPRPITDEAMIMEVLEAAW